MQILIILKLLKHLIKLNIIFFPYLKCCGVSNISLFYPPTFKRISIYRETKFTDMLQNVIFNRNEKKKIKQYKKNHDHIKD